jgi:hypothetical protein
MRRRLRACLLTGLLFIAPVAMADRPPFTWVQGGWFTEDPSSDSLSVTKKSYDEIFGQNKSRVGAVVYLGPIGLGLDLFATNETSGAAS